MSESISCGTPPAITSPIPTLIHMCNWEGWTMQGITLKVQLQCGSVRRSNHIVKESMLQLSLYCAYESHGNWSAGHSPKRPNQGRKRRQTSWRLGTDWHNLLVKQQKLRIEDLSKCNWKCVCLMFCLSYLLNVFESFPQTESLILAPPQKKSSPSAHCYQQQCKNVLSQWLCVGLSPVKLGVSKSEGRR